VPGSKNLSSKSQGLSIDFQSAVPLNQNKNLSRLLVFMTQTSPLESSYEWKSSTQVH